MMTPAQTALRLINSVLCERKVLEAAFLACLIMGQATSASAAILTGGAPDPTHEGNSMQLWLRADQGVTTGGTFTWADQSTHGNDASQSTASAQPTHITVGAGTINSLPVVDFDGSTDNLLGSLSSSLSSDNFTAFIVMHTPSHPVANSFHPFDGNTISNRFGFASYFGVTTQEYFLRFDSSPTSGVALNSNPVLFSTVGTPVSTNTIAQDLNGSNILTSTFGATTTINGYRLGSRFDGTAAFMDGSIAELIIYDQQLSEAEYNAVGYYLQNKYGLTGAFTAPLPVPEPGALSLVLMGGAALMLRRRKNREESLVRK